MKRAKSIETFSTARLAASRPSLENLGEYYELHQDARVMATLSADGKVLSRDETVRRLHALLDHWAQHGFGPWMYRAKETSRYVGYCGFQRAVLEGKPLVELICAVKSDFWRQGFASEMAEAALRLGFSRLGLTDVAGWTLSGNLAARRVMEKMGFMYERDILRADLPHALYRLTKADWQHRRKRAAPG